MMPEKRTPARMDQLRDLVQFVSDHITKRRFPESRSAQVELATEEVLVNIFLHAYPETPGDVAVAVDVTGEGLCILRFEDHGIPFDPLAVAAPDVSAPLSDRKPGGLGILFIRNTADRVTYRRSGDRNFLTLEFSGVSGG